MKRLFHIPRFVPTSCTQSAAASFYLTLFLLALFYSARSLPSLILSEFLRLPRPSPPLLRAQAHTSGDAFLLCRVSHFFISFIALLGSSGSCLYYLLGNGATTMQKDSQEITTKRLLINYLCIDSRKLDFFLLGISFVASKSLSKSQYMPANYFFFPAIEVSKALNKLNSDEILPFQLRPLFVYSNEPFESKSAPRASPNKQRFRGQDV